MAISSAERDAIFIERYIYVWIYETRHTGYTRGGGGSEVFLCLCRGGNLCRSAAVASSSRNRCSRYRDPVPRSPLAVGDASAGGGGYSGGRSKAASCETIVGEKWVIRM